MICARSVGLDIALPVLKLPRLTKYEDDVGTEGEDAPELMPVFGTGIEIGMLKRGELELRPLNSEEMDGETARRLEALGYGSYRSSTVCASAELQYVRTHWTHISVC